MDLAIVALLIVGVYAFLQLVGWQTRMFTRRTKRTAEAMYDQYAGSPHKQRRDAKKHAGV